MAFNPTIWSPLYNEYLREKVVFAQLVNTDHEGEIRNAGDQVRILNVGAVETSREYYTTRVEKTAGATSETTQTLLIDQTSDWALKYEAVEEVQRQGSKRLRDLQAAAHATALDIDKDIAGLYTDAGIKLSDSGSAYTVGFGTNDIEPFDLLADLSAEFDDNDVPETERWVVIPPWFKAMLKKDKYFRDVIADYYATRTIPDVDGMKLLWSNQLVNNGTDWNILAGHRLGISWAGQLAQMTEDKVAFKTIVRGLTLWGRKVVQPNAVATILAAKGSAG